MSKIVLLNEREAAEFLRVRTKTLSAWRYRGTGGPVFRKIGRLIRYLEDDLLRYVESRARQSTSKDPDHGDRNRKAISAGKVV